MVDELQTSISYLHGANTQHCHTKQQFNWTYEMHTQASFLRLSFSQLDR